MSTTCVVDGCSTKQDCAFCLKHVLQASTCADKICGTCAKLKAPKKTDTPKTDPPKPKTEQKHCRNCTKTQSPFGMYTDPEQKYLDTPNLYPPFPTDPTDDQIRRVGRKANNTYYQNCQWDGAKSKPGCKYSTHCSQRRKQEGRPWSDRISDACAGVPAKPPKKTGNNRPWYNAPHDSYQDMPYVLGRDKETWWKRYFDQDKGKYRFAKMKEAPGR